MNPYDSSRWPLWLTAADIGKLRGIGKRAAQRRIKAGTYGPFTKDGKKFVVPKEQFLVFMAPKPQRKRRQRTSR